MGDFGWLVEFFGFFSVDDKLVTDQILPLQKGCLCPWNLQEWHCWWLSQIQHLHLPPPGIEACAGSPRRSSRGKSWQNLDPGAAVNPSLLWPTFPPSFSPFFTFEVLTAREPLEWLKSWRTTPSAARSQFYLASATEMSCLRFLVFFLEILTTVVLKNQCVFLHLGEKEFPWSSLSKAFFKSNTSGNWYIPVVFSLCQQNL